VCGIVYAAQVGVTKKRRKEAGEGKEECQAIE
jgi:hypothetical protein